MSSRIRRCSRSFAARSYFAVSIGTTYATLKVCLAFTFVQLAQRPLPDDSLGIVARGEANVAVPG